MLEVESLLTELGLTRTESALYLSGLKEGPLTAQQLANVTGIKRPTVYHALSTLSAKGLLTERKSGNKTLVAMTSPEHLRNYIARQKEQIDEQARSLESLIPLLVQQAKSGQKDDVQLVHYHGIEGMKLVMDVAFYCKSKRWDVLAPYANFLREYDRAYADRYLRARKFHGITSRTLWENNMRPSRDLTDEEKHERNPRLMPPALWGKFKSMMIIFDDKVAIFSSYEKLSAVLITSNDLHAMFQAMFDGLWEVSEGY